jgi:hypothetical protein
MEHMLGYLIAQIILSDYINTFPTLGTMALFSYLLVAFVTT